jgi:NADH:ubiquinone oxidoreductase subunit 5 (subunit L)/multisubunit Na+/H+ antiporter MnhA subunit
MIIGLVGAFLTAAYMMRCVYLTFLGTYRGGSTASTSIADPRARAGPGIGPRRRADGRGGGRHVRDGRGRS